ncbi:hypothetical protein L228DRAFT_239375 [Xylona heveae TC161]|uniref:Fibroin-3 related protein n=1 Tax=Xylona heveae (strain CBS 132557 / TC161) TaxID=1328760 RepID=A0A165GNK3_XYLHT|nr:hypothetical protein L228DRAFT_239375 [Xylona heveae TC161]KZF22406.1 hypothetical protein L228DRAFT_239375 [Xylona heveae TC161]
MPGAIRIRDALTSVEQAPSTFSSWDKCMQKSYCKWPAIVGIIIGAVIIFSLLWCLIRCLCCGVSCCCDCMSCCTSCCPSGRGGGRRHNRRDSYQPAPYAPPFPPTGYQSAPPAPSYQPQQFAQFPINSRGGAGAGKTPTAVVNEDALPAMPTWGTARTRHEEDHAPNNDSAVELGHLNPARATRPLQEAGMGARSPGISNAAAAAAAGQTSPMLPRQNSYPRAQFTPQSNGLTPVSPQSPPMVPTPHAQGFVEADSNTVAAPYSQYQPYGQGYHPRGASPYQPYELATSTSQSPTGYGGGYHSPVYGPGEHPVRSPVGPGYPHSTSPVLHGGYAQPTSPVNQGMAQGGYHQPTSPVQQQGYHPYQAHGQYYSGPYQ